MSGTTASPICGFDIGTENSYIGVARQGGLEILLNDYSQRSTPGYVCMTDKQRELGVSAKQKQNMYIQSTFYNLRRLVGRPFEEVQSEENLPFPIQKAENGEAAVQVTIDNEEVQLTATQLLAMVFTKLRQLANNPTECVINCPGYFTDRQRRALHDAANIAGLHPLRIMPDLSAVALYYCFYRLNPRDEANRLIGFVDVGASSTQCSIVYYEAKRNSVTVLGSEYDSNLGGRDFDNAIAEHFINAQRLQLNKRARIRLLAECEKLKKQMSANSNELPIGIECLYDERDFSGRLSRTTFEQLCEKHFERINCVLTRTLENAKKTYAKLQADAKEPMPEFNIENVEVVGGSSRVPAIKRIIRDVFNIDATATMNADEAVALGCTLQSALLSPNFKVARELQVVDYQPYQINAKYWHANVPNAKVFSIAPLFTKGDAVPFTRQISLTCHSLPINIELDCLDDQANVSQLGQYSIVSPQPIEFASSKLKVRVRLGNSGIIAFTSATLHVEEPVSEVTMEGDVPMESDQQDAKNTDSKPKTRINNVELQLNPIFVTGRLDEKELDRCRILENNLVLADKNWRERSDARNELEEFVYEWRDRLDGSDYQQYLTENEKNDFASELRSTQNWLQDDEDSGEMQPRKVYFDRLSALKQQFSEIVLFRRREHEARESALERLGKCIQMANKVLVEADERLDAQLVNKLKEEISGRQVWFENAHQVYVNFVLNQQPPVLVNEIYSQGEQLEKAIKPVLEQQQKLRKQDEDEKAKAAAAAKETGEKVEAEPQAKPEGQNGEAQNGTMDLD